MTKTTGTPTINNAIQFIQKAGVNGLISGVNTGLIDPIQAHTAFRAVGEAMDSYIEVIKDGEPLGRLWVALQGLPNTGPVSTYASQNIVQLLHANRAIVEDSVDHYVGLALQAYDHSATQAAGIEPPYDLGHEWAWIPPGRFQMGKPGIEYAPVQWVKLGGFYIAKQLVSNAEYREFLRATGKPDKLNFASVGTSVMEEIHKDNRPIVLANYESAKGYAAWHGAKVLAETGHPVIGMLPSSPQWEKAAQGPEGNEYVAHLDGGKFCYRAHWTRDVDSPDAIENGFGIKDMNSNVMVWTRTFAGQSAFTHRVVRGRAFNAPNKQLSYLDSTCNQFGGIHVGIRLILVVDDGSEKEGE